MEVGDEPSHVEIVAGDLVHGHDGILQTARKSALTASIELQFTKVVQGWFGCLGRKCSSDQAVRQKR